MNNIFLLTDAIEGTLLVLIILVSILIAILGIGSTIVSIILAIKYIKYNRTKNSIGKSGKEVAREILDQNGLQKIKVSKNGSILFGNSYSHYFKKVRLRRLTWKKDSVSSLAMAAQKSSLAILDKEGDKDMKLRVKLVPLITFGPFAFIPLIVIGILLDIFLFAGGFVCTIITSTFGFLLLVYSFILQIKTLKTEKKAQERAYEILKENNMATEQELDDMKELFKLYNIEYINDVILAFLEIIYRILRVAYTLYSNSSKKSSN